MKNDRDALLSALARQYAEDWGRELQREATALPPAHAPGLDRKVREGLSRRRRVRRQMISFGAVAACVALIVAAGLLYPGPGAPKGSMNEAAQAQAEDSLTDSEKNLGLTPTNAAPSAEAPEVSMSVLPLTFDLPAQFAVADVTVDNGQTVYTLSDVLLDPVVLAMEATDAPIDTGRLIPVTLGGETVYARSTADFSLITFNRDGLRYTLTCRYDINTLLGLGREILL